MMIGCAFLVGLLVPNLPASAQTLAHRGWAGSGLNVDPWWQDAVFYELNRAFFSDVHDGVEDVARLALRFDYLKSIGVDAIVLTESGLQPAAATTEAAARLEEKQEESFNSLVGEASRRHLRIIVDLPLDQQSAAATLATARFWLGRGVAGLRLTLPQSAATAGNSAPADLVRLVHDLRAVCTSYTGDRVLLWDSRVPFSALVDDANQSDVEAAPASARHGVGRRRRAAAVPHKAATQVDAVPQLEVEDDLERLPALNAMELRATLIGAGISNSHPRSLPVFITDSDGSPRSIDRYSSPEKAGGAPPPAAFAKLLATALFTTSAVPMLYFGQEIGLPSAHLPELSASGSGGEATMPWGDATNAATGGAVTPMATNSSAVNVAAEEGDPDSLLNFYRHLSNLRHANAALRSGSFQLLRLDLPEVVAWVRTVRDGGSLRPPVMVVCNLSARAQVVPLNTELHRVGIREAPHSSMRVLLDSRPIGAGASNPAASTTGLELAPYGVLVGELTTLHGLEHTHLPRRHRSRRRHR